MWTKIGSRVIGTTLHQFYKIEELTNYGTKKISFRHTCVDLEEIYRFGQDDDMSLLP